MNPRPRKAPTGGAEWHCLSIRQPYAWAIIKGAKDVENRTWRLNYRGRLYIHAGLKPYPEDVVEDIVARGGKLRREIRILGPSHSAALRRIQHQGLAVEAVRIHHKGVGHDRPQTPRRGIRQLVLPCVPDVVRGVIEAQRALKRRACDGIDCCGPLHVDNREGAAGVAGPAVESFPVDAVAAFAASILTAPRSQRPGTASAFAAALAAVSGNAQQFFFNRPVRFPPPMRHSG